MSLRVLTVYFLLQSGDTLTATLAMLAYPMLAGVLLQWRCPFLFVTSPFLQRAVINYNEEKDLHLGCTKCREVKQQKYR